jgi:hypothetical protein
MYFTDGIAVWLILRFGVGWSYGLFINSHYCNRDYHNSVGSSGNGSGRDSGDNIDGVASVVSNPPSGGGVFSLSGQCGGGYYTSGAGAGAVRVFEQKVALEDGIVFCAFALLEALPCV